MTWQGTKTWAPLEPGRSTDFNTYISDNLDYLLNRPVAIQLVNEGADYTTSSSTFADVDATDLSKTITTNGGDVLVAFLCSVINSSQRATYLDLDVDGARQGGNDGLACTVAAADLPSALPLFCLVTGLAAGSHTFKIQWKRSAGTSTMYAGAGTTIGTSSIPADLHPFLFVKEV